MAPPSIIDFVERLDRNRDSYTASNYNEKQFRLEFPFLTLTTACRKPDKAEERPEGPGRDAGFKVVV